MGKEKFARRKTVLETMARIQNAGYTARINEELIPFRESMAEGERAEFFEMLHESDTEDGVFYGTFQRFEHYFGKMYGMAYSTNDKSKLTLVSRFGPGLTTEPNIHLRGPHQEDVCKKIGDIFNKSIIVKPQVRAHNYVPQELMHSLTNPKNKRIFANASFLQIPLVIGKRDLVGTYILYRFGDQGFIPAAEEFANFISGPLAERLTQVD
jgi:hypothetical protein